MSRYSKPTRWMEIGENKGRHDSGYIAGFIAARDLAASLVCPHPQIEEERNCEDVAQAIRDLDPLDNLPQDKWSLYYREIEKLEEENFSLWEANLPFIPTSSVKQRIDHVRGGLGNLILLLEDEPRKMRKRFTIGGKSVLMQLEPSGRWIPVKRGLNPYV